MKAPFSVQKEYPFVSVIVPVFGYSKILLACLAALEGQTYPPDKYEVILVDNGGNAGLEKDIAGFAHVRLVQEKKPGSYAARNKGIAQAKADMLAFTDSDCIPERDWIASGTGSFLSTPGCGLVAGRVEYGYKDDARPGIFEICDAVLFSMDQEFNILQRRCAGTSNLFTSRAVLGKIGYFNEALKAGGDDEWSYRVYLGGYAQVYAAASGVKHNARDSLKAIVSRGMRIAGAEYCAGLLGKRCVPVLCGFVSFSLWFRAAWLLRSIRLEVFRNTRIKHKLLVTCAVLPVQMLLSLCKSFEYARLICGAQPRR